MRYPIESEMVAQLKEWFGLDDDMIAMITKARGLRLVYRIMLKEKEVSNGK